LPAYIRCSRDEFPRRVANLASAIQVGDRKNHEKALSVLWLTCRPVENVGTLLIELEAEDFRFDPSYPDFQAERNDDFVLIEILWSVGRSVKAKKKLLEELMATLARSGFNPANVMVCFKETSWENWSFAGGRLIHA